MSLRLVLVRHAETAWNRERRYQGWQDTPLSELGRTQADAAARLLAAQPLAAVWSSPLQRARDTAAAIAAAQRLTVQEEAAFKEMRFGQWEGLTRDEVSARFPDAYQMWAQSPHQAVVPGGETLAEVRERVLRGLGDLREAHDGQTVCLVAHGISARLLILEALGLGLDRLWSLQISSTGISELEFRHDWAAVHRMNTLVHLERVPVPRPGPIGERARAT
ncbi:MAG TPA: histidine phosphatase family protein [Methylomirabilota bacterium]|jgi:broad specificity phosphatase PhoE|nr:histidine phosphatase family protein [Methylomirabilota bacterium]